MSSSFKACSGFRAYGCYFLTSSPTTNCSSDFLTGVTSKILALRLELRTIRVSDGYSNQLS